MLFLILDRNRWGYCNSIVRADNKEEAQKLAGVYPIPTTELADRVQILELKEDGISGILWSEEESPDTND